MGNKYYGVEPYTGKIIQHFGIPGMKWGWTKDGKKTGAKEAMTEQERAQRRKDLIKKIGAGVGTAAAVAGTALAIKNRKKIGNFVQGLKNRRIADKVNGRYISLKDRISSLTSKTRKGLTGVGGKIKRGASSLGSSAGTARVRTNLLGKEIRTRGGSALTSIKKLGTKTKNATGRGLYRLGSRIAGYRN